MVIEYVSVGLGLVSIGLFFLGFYLGKKSQIDEQTSSESQQHLTSEYDINKPR